MWDESVQAMVLGSLVVLQSPTSYFVTHKKAPLAGSLFQQKDAVRAPSLCQINFDGPSGQRYVGRDLIYTGRHVFDDEAALVIAHRGEGLLFST